jgi:hypothetical protein
MQQVIIIRVSNSSSSLLPSVYAQHPVGPAAPIDDLLSSFSSGLLYGILTTNQSHKNFPKIAPRITEIKIYPLKFITSNITMYAKPSVTP